MRLAINTRWAWIYVTSNKVVLKVVIMVVLTVVLNFVLDVVLDLVLALILAAYAKLSMMMVISLVWFAEPTYEISTLYDA